MRDLRRSIIFPDENQGNLIGPRHRTAQAAGIRQHGTHSVSDGEPCKRCGRQRRIRIVADRLARQRSLKIAITLARCSATSCVKPKRPS
jgi:hypothetical protein